MVLGARAPGRVGPRQKIFSIRPPCFQGGLIFDLLLNENKEKTIVGKN